MCLRLSCPVGAFHYLGLGTLELIHLIRPMVERIGMLLYWPHASALVAHNGGTNVGHPAIVNIAHVLQKLHFFLIFQFFL